MPSAFAAVSSHSGRTHPDESGIGKRKPQMGGSLSARCHGHWRPPCNGTNGHFGCQVRPESSFADDDQNHPGEHEERASDHPRRHSLDALKK